MRSTGSRFSREAREARRSRLRMEAPLMLAAWCSVLGALIVIVQPYGRCEVCGGGVADRVEMVRIQFFNSHAQLTHWKPLVMRCRTKGLRSARSE